MLTSNEPFEDADAESLAPACRATVNAIQRALDGETALDSLHADPHPGACAACRERLRATRVLLSVLALPSEAVVVPTGFTDRTVKAMWEDRHARTRRGVYKVTAYLALAAAILVAAFAILKPSSKPEPAVHLAPLEMTKQPEVAPEPQPKAPTPAPVPEQRPLRLGDEFAKAGQVFRDAPKPIADSVAVAPKLLDLFAAAFANPAAPRAPMGDRLEPARRSLAELPDAARAGFEPVAGTAQKAYTRLLRDVASVKPKPNS